MRILITGSTGLLGKALYRRLAAAQHELTGASRRPAAEAAQARYVSCDLTQDGAAARLVESVRPQAVIHAQALSDVDACELQPQEARRQNQDAPARLAEALSESGIPLFYISTDYVFDGSAAQPYDEQSQPNPLSVYGRSKWEGEKAVLRYTGGIVVRPSTLFGPDRTNFCDAVVSAAKEGRTIDVFADQTTSPTYTEDAADALAALLEKPPPAWWRQPRIVHVANAGFCSRLAFATRTVDLLGLPRHCLRPLPLKALNRPAPRPAFSALATTVLDKLIGRTLRPWDQALEAYLRQHRWLS